MTLLSSSSRALLEKATAQYQDAMSTKELSYLTERGLTPYAIEAARLGVVTSPIPGHEFADGRLAIPYLTRTGVVAMRFRCLAHTSCASVGCPKYLGLPGIESHVYNTRALWDAGYEIGVCEGELDALAMTYTVGMPAVGLPGVTSWKPHMARLFQGFERVWVFGDGDEPGREFAKHLVSELPNAVSVPVPSGEDVSSWVVHDGWESVVDVLEGLA